MSDTAPTSTLKGYIPTRDGWRAVAVLGVMVSYAGVWQTLPVNLIAAIACATASYCPRSATPVIAAA
jgi:hypothetical protein